MSDIVHSVREAVQDLLALEIREIKGDVRALDVKVESVRVELNTKFDSVRTEVDHLRDEIHTSTQTIVTTLQNAVLRGKLEDRGEIADLRERVARLENGTLSGIEIPLQSPATSQELLFQSRHFAYTHNRRQET